MDSGAGNRLRPRDLHRQRHVRGPPDGEAEQRPPGPRGQAREAGTGGSGRFEF